MRKGKWMKSHSVDLFAVTRHKRLVITGLLLSACIAQSDVQADYISMERQCRDDANSKASAMRASQAGTPMEGETGNAEAAFAAASTFSKCMQTQGWKVYTPKDPKAPQTANATNTAPLGAPGPGGIVTMRQAQPAPVRQRQPAAAVVQRPAPAPQPAPAAVAPRPATLQKTPPAAAVQPVAPTTSPTAPPAIATPAAPTVPPRAIRVPAGVSTYQPARPPGTLAPEYGRGVGRQF